MAKSKKTELNNKPIIIAIAMIAVAIIIIILYFVFVNKNTKIGTYEKVDPEFAWTLQDLEQEVNSYDIYSHQDEEWNKLMDQYKKEKPDLDKAIVKVDPFGISPQTAIILFKTKKDEKVTLTVKGKHNDDIVKTFEASKDHFIPVFGLYGRYKNTVIVTTESGDSKQFDIQIDKYKEQGFNEDGSVFDVVEVNEGGNNEFYFGTSSLGTATIAYDRFGEIRWWLDEVGYTKGMTMLQNGNMLLSSYSVGPDIQSTGGVVEIDMFGKVYHEYSIEGGYHHDGYELPNGNLIILTTDVNSDSMADYIVELDRQSGKIVNDWSIRKIVDEIDPNISSTYVTWAWINSVYYDEANNALILSLRNCNSVMSLDYTTKKINWILGDKKYWSDKFNDVLLTGVGTDFSYTQGQHSVKFVDGVLSLFDNGYDAYREQTKTCASLKNNASYAKKYKIDAQNKTAELIWKYGGVDIFSYALSSFNYTSDGHKLINSGWHMDATAKNLDDPECTQFNNDEYDTFIIELDENDKVINKLHLYESKFEVIKADIYNLANVSVKPNKVDVNPNYKFEYAVATDTRDAQYTEISREDALAYKDAEDMLFSVHANNGRLGLNVIVDSNEKYDIAFISATGKAYLFNYLASDSRLEKEINYYQLPKGKYRVFVVMNGYKYDTLQYVTVK